MPKGLSSTQNALNISDTVVPTFHIFRLNKYVDSPTHGRDDYLQNLVGGVH